MKYLSLFSGVGSEAIAWSHLSWECVANAETDSHASAVLKYHHPNTPNLGDVTRVNWEKYKGQVDLLIGGSPCQAFSLAGLRKGLDDERGNLALEYCHAVRTIKPRFFIWENVPGVLSDKTNAFGSLLAGLLGEDSPLLPTKSEKWENAGFFIGEECAIAYRVLNSQYFGVPQRRRRIYLLGMYFRDCGGLHTAHWGDLSKLAGIPAAILFEPESEGWDSKESEKSQSPNSRATKTSTILAFSSKDSGSDCGAISPTLRSCGHKDSYPNAGAPPAIARCLTTTPEVKYEVRNLTPVECERLQGYPDDWTNVPFNGKSMPKGARYKMCGNGITANVLRWLGNRIESQSNLLFSVK